MMTYPRIACLTFWALSLAIGLATNSRVHSAEGTTSLVLEKPLPVDPKADEIAKLTIERRNAAIELLHAQYALFLGGKGSIDLVVAAAERAFRAQSEVPGSNKLQLLEQHVKFAGDLNNVVTERFNAGVADATSHGAAKYLRLEMELRLAHEKQSAKKKT